MRHTSASTASAALALALGATLLAVPPAPDSAAAEAGPASRLSATYDCLNKELAGRATCGYLTVPLDHAEPAGTKIKLGLAIIPATAPKAQRLGLLVVNAGGPGAPGLTWAGTMADLLGPALAARYDILGLDPRGVGSSQPRLTCDPNYKKGPRPDYTPTTGRTGPLSATEKTWLAKAKAYAAACAKKYPALLPHMTTLDNARDLEALRKGFGQEKISFFGFSYGSYLGQVYATKFPTRLRRMVLDGIADPRDVWYPAQLKQSEGLEVGIRQFWGWVARNHAAYGLGATATDVRARYLREKARLRTSPVGRVGPAEWTDVFLDAAYYRRTWPNIAAAFKAWVHGDRAALTKRWDKAAGVGVDTGTVMYLASTCTDAAWPRDYATWRRDAFGIVADAPFETWGNVWDNAGCLYWPVRGGTPVTVGTSKAPGSLMLTATLGGATPYTGALEARRRFPTARLVVEVGGTTHTISTTGNTCVNRRIVDYLRDGKLPAKATGNRADLGCTQVPLPKP